MPVKHRLGSLDLAIVSDGTYMIDAGATFGIVPRVMWEPFAGELDDRHRLGLALNCLLLRSQGKLILVETGVGERRKPARRNATPEEQGNLLSELAALGVRPEDIDIVLNTHLHSDHCGWNTRSAGETFVPTFPRAEYMIVREEWEAAVRPNERTRATYIAENLLPLQEHGRLNLVEGETRVTDEVTIVPTPGHSAGHASIVLASGGETAVYIGDVAQVAVQLERTAWVSSFDILPLVSMQTKRDLVERAIRENHLIIGVHFAYPGLGRLRRTEQGLRRWEPLAPED